MNTTEAKLKRKLRLNKLQEVKLFLDKEVGKNQYTADIWRRGMYINITNPNMTKLTYSFLKKLEQLVGENIEIYTIERGLITINIRF